MQSIAVAVFPCVLLLRKSKRKQIENVGLLTRHSEFVELLKKLPPGYMTLLNIFHALEYVVRVNH